MVPLFIYLNFICRRQGRAESHQWLQSFSGMSAHRTRTLLGGNDGDHYEATKTTALRIHLELVRVQLHYFRLVLQFLLRSVLGPLFSSSSSSIWSFNNYSILLNRLELDSDCVLITNYYRLTCGIVRERIASLW